MIKRGSIVTIHYVLSDEHGNIIDSSHSEGPWTFVYGEEELIEGLENHLHGSRKGQKLNFELTPEMAYGNIDDDLILDIPIELFHSQDELYPGVQCEVETDQGVFTVTVLETNGDQVLVDANHPLAGKNLNFKIDVLEVKEPYKEPDFYSMDHKDKILH